MRTILLATTNPGKLAELSAMLGVDVAWKNLTDFPDVQTVEEDGRTFAENARKKALGYAAQMGLWTLADDSGLVIDALDGAPGVQSARFCGAADARDRATIDRLNNARVLELLADVPDEQRTARFMCCLCLAEPGKVLAESQGTFEGQILRQARGENGFGYDPIFYVPDSGRTVAELSREQKNAISHRARAVAAMRPHLVRLLSG